MLSPSLTERLEYQTVGNILALIVVGLTDVSCAKVFEAPIDKHARDTNNRNAKYLFIIY